MKSIVKLLFAPINGILALFVWVCSGILYCSSWLFGIAGTLLGLLGLAVLVTYSVKNGIILLCIAAIVSPIGIPMLAVKLIGLVEKLRCGLWTIFCG